MKVKELIELLKKEDQEAEVITEGCDCAGEAKGVSHNKEVNTVCIDRE